MKHIIAISFAIFMLLCAQASSAQIVIVANVKSSVNTLTKDQAEALFLGKLFSLPNAGLALLIDQPESSEIRTEFYKKISGKSVVQVKGIWMRLVFSGKGVPPSVVATSAEVKNAVVRNTDVIGYIEKSAVDNTVKVVFTLE